MAVESSHPPEDPGSGVAATEPPSPSDPALVPASADGASSATTQETPGQTPAEDPVVGRAGRRGTPKRGGPLTFLRELPVLLLIAFVLALLIKSFLIQAF